MKFNKIVLFLLLILGLLSLTSCTVNIQVRKEAESIEKIDYNEIFPDEKLDKPSESLVAEDYTPVTMTFVGDVYLSDVLYQKYSEAGVLGFLSPKVKEVIYDADLSIMNHEYVATDGVAKVDYQLFTFKAPKERQVILQEMGVDIMTLANNHILDYGIEGLSDTMESLDALEIAYMGAGNNVAEAMAPVIKEVQGKKIGFLAASRFIPTGGWYALENRPGVMATYESRPEYQMLLDEIKRTKEEENCDFVVVYLHFGIEKEVMPADYQRTLSHSYIDAGADLVIGSHAHRIQGIEYYKDKMIFYNLGNFLFSNYPSDSVVVQIEINEDNSYQAKVLPCKSQNYRTEDISGVEAETLYGEILDRSFGISIDVEGNISQNQ